MPNPFLRQCLPALLALGLFALVYGVGHAVLYLLAPSSGTGPVADITSPGGPLVAPPEPAFDLAAYVADPVHGARAAAQCKACHSFDKGGFNRTGPNLWGIVDAPIAHHKGYTYSAALVAYQDQAGTWTPAHLDAYLANPKAAVPGTRMIFTGIASPRERADLIAWLQTLK